MPELETLLLERACQGDFEAFAQLQELLEPSLRRFIRRLIGSHDSEDDIVQTVFISLYRNMHKISPPENLRPYVFRMVRNRCYDELRAAGKWKSVSMDDDAVEVYVSFNASASEPQPEDVSHWLLLQLEVREAMEKLPELQRQTLILFAEEEMSYAEIAEAMDTSIGTVKSRLHHAKKTLRGLLKPETLQAIESSLGMDEE